DISSPFEELSDIGSPRADDHKHLMLPETLEDPYVEVALQAPPSLDYIPDPEEPEQATPSPDYVPGPKHVDDEIVVEDQPYAEDASPIAQSLEYVPESVFEAHPEDDDDEDPEEDPVDYLADGGDDGDDEEESSEDDEDDDMDIEADEEEEEKHPAPVVVAPTATDQAPSAEKTKPFETDESAATPPPHPAYRMTVRIFRNLTDQETINATSVTNAQLQAMIDEGVTVALAARDALRSTNGDDSHNSGTCVRRTERATRKCTYTDFLKCQPLPFKGTEGVASLSQWCERMESVFHISNCAAENQVKFTTCTLHSIALCKVLDIITQAWKIGLVH
nr:hypothetical protein [Tanacetum cinerariifolium]